jgi:hypothetical protein
MRVATPPLSYWIRAKLILVEVVVVEKREVVVLMPKRTNTPDQQPLPTLRTIDWKGQTCNHDNYHEHRLYLRGYTEKTTPRTGCQR